MFGELHVFVGADFVVTVRHAESPDLGRVRRRLEQTPALLSVGPEAILYAILDQVVDEYAPVVAGLENDIDEIEDQLFDGDPAVSQAHLRAVPRGDRVPARHPPAARRADRARARLRQVRGGRRAAAQPA
ncbi:MAG: CorA family divalent cation transporter [Nocardioidaceae bacterium]